LERAEVILSTGDQFTIGALLANDVSQFLEAEEEDKQKVFDLGATDYFVKSNSPLSQIVENIKSKL
jgi:protein-tyrosine phosphatase